MLFFEYVKDLIAIETVQRNFKWTFGQSMSQTDREHYEKSLIRVHLRIEKDDNISKSLEQNKDDYLQFSSFFVSPQKQEIVFHRNWFKILPTAFKLRLDENEIFFSVGQAYYHLIKLRIMNMHSVRYILSDLVSGLLLLNNYAPLYCATVCIEEKAIMLFGGPSTGKTVSATQLVKHQNGCLLSEDVSISDGNSIWAVPFTSTFGQHEKGFCKKKKSAFIHGELIVKHNSEKSIFILEKGEQVSEEKITKKISLLNRYIFHYDSSPINIVCAYFFDGFSLQKMRENEEKIVNKLCADSTACILHEKSSGHFADRIAESIFKS